MSVFVVTDRFVQGCASSARLLVDVLYSFVQRNQLRVAVDEPARDVLKTYGEIARGSSDIAQWLIYLSKDPDFNIEHVSVLEGLQTFSLFVRLAVSAGPKSTMVVWSADEHDKDCEQQGIDRVDRLGVVARLSPATVKFVRKAPRRGPMNVQIENYFSGNSDFVFVSKASVQGSVAKFAQAAPDLARVLVDVTREVEQSKSKPAGELWTEFNEELTKSQPRKALLRAVWDGLVRILPDVGRVAGAAEQLGKVFG